MKKILILLLVSFFIQQNSNAQLCQRRTYDYGLQAGLSYYIGDINLRKQFYKPSPAYGLVYRLNYTPRYAVRVSISHSNIQANDSDFKNEYQQTRAASFKSGITEISYRGEFNFMEFNLQSDRDKFSPYITAGISFADIDNVKSLVFSIPMGAGFKYKVGKHLSAGFEWIFHKTFNDKLDQITSKDFPKNSVNIGKQYNYTRNKDWFSSGTVFITYTYFGSKTKCSSYMTK